MAPSEADEMLSNIRPNLVNVLDRIASASRLRSQELQGPIPRLVAVSKLKPCEAIIEAYNAGQRHFGENYIQELVDKSLDDNIQKQCPQIKWHFIGNLQRNKINKLLSAVNLHMVETVDSVKLADGLNQRLVTLKADRLNIMVQVNTSQESNKNGCPPESVSDLAEHVSQNCPQLKLIGLMTIGAIGRDPEAGPNPDFQKLFECRKLVSQRLGQDELDLELSMGMSADFEEAIQTGSTSVRVGSTIFGARPVKDKAASPPSNANATKVASES